MTDALSAKIQQYFATVFETITKHGCHPLLYINADETFNDATDDSKVKVMRYVLIHNFVILCIISQQLRI